MQNTAERARRPLDGGDPIGRHREKAILDGVVQSAAAGRSRWLVLSGSVGAGKTTLLRWLASRAEDAGFTVVTVVGAPFEAHLTFGGLLGALRPFGHRVAQLPRPQADALDAALGRAEGTAGALATYAATLTVLTAAAEDAPVLVLVDDAQWVDQPSLAALAFAARRCDRDRVAFVFARDERPSPALDELMTTAGTPAELRLAGLEREESAELLAREGVARDVARRCWSLTGGNPMALIEGAAGLTADQRSGRSPFPAVLPLPDRLLAPVQRLLTEVAPEALRALAVAALVHDDDSRVIAEALTRLGWPVADLFASGVREVLTIDGERVAWHHPLLRTAALELMDAPTRRKVHRVLAELRLPTSDIEAVAWHLSESVDGSDESTARRLDTVAQRADRIGAQHVAAVAWERAAQLSSCAAGRLRRNLAAADAWSARGDYHRVLDRLEPEIDPHGDPVLQAELALLMGRAETWLRDPCDAAARLEASAAAVERRAPALAAMLSLQAAMSGLLALDATGAATNARRAASTARRIDDPTAYLRTSAILSLTDLLRGAAPDVNETVTAALLIRATLDAGSPGADLAAFCALGHAAREDWATAEELLRHCLRRSERDGSPGQVPLARAVLADVLWRRGRWDESLAVASQLLSLQEAGGQPHLIPLAHAALARCAAGLGNVEDCHAHAHRAVETAERHGLHHVRVIALHALGLEALGRQDHPAAAAAFDHIEALCRDIAEPAWLRWRADAIEAWQGAARRDIAHRELEILTHQAERTGRTWTHAAAQRGMALLNPSDDSDRRLTEAVRGFGAGAPFDQARTLLLRGERRLAAGRRHDGGRDLAAARRTFDRLGAQAWSNRTSTARGEAHGGSSSLSAHLTPAELRVALAVGRGDTNRQAADSLYVSTKTVGYHLENIYRKLGIRSRSQLAAIVATHE